MGSIAIVVNTLINFFVIPYVTENIGVIAYGYVTLANTLVTYIDVISIALNSFAGRFIAIEYHQRKYDQSSRFYSSIFIADVFLGGIILFIGTIFTCNLETFINISTDLEKDVKVLFLIVLVRYFVILLRNPFEIAAFIKNRLDLTEKFRAVSYFLQAIILLFLCRTLPPHVWYVSIATLFSSLLLLYIYATMARKMVPELTIKISYLSFACIKDFLITGIWTSINNIGNLLNSGLDLLIANKMLADIIMGMISISKTIGTICYTLILAISNSFRPKQLELYSKGNKTELIKSLKQSMKITGAICSIVISGFYVCGKEFLNLWIPGQDINIIFILCMIVLFSDVMPGVVNPLYYVFTLTKRLKLPCFITIVMGIINVTGMYLLIKYTSLGAYAVVVTTAILNCTHFIDTPLYSAHCLGIPKKTFYSVILLHLLNQILLFITMIFLNSRYSEITGWLQLVIKIVFFGTWGIIVSLLTLSTKSEKKTFLKKVKKYLYAKR